MYRITDFLQHVKGTTNFTSDPTTNSHIVNDVFPTQQRNIFLFIFTYYIKTFKEWIINYKQSKEDTTESNQSLLQAAISRKKTHTPKTRRGHNTKMWEWKKIKKIQLKFKNWMSVPLVFSMTFLSFSFIVLFPFIDDLFADDVHCWLISATLAYQLQCLSICQEFHLFSIYLSMYLWAS